MIKTTKPKITQLHITLQKYNMYNVYYNKWSLKIITKCDKLL